jgi:hypothetical protein
MKPYPYAFHVALDGNGINGFEGLAGVCLFHYDPADHRYAYKVKYFDGIAAGHAVIVSPDRRLGFLGNASQQLLFYDAQTLEEVRRASTLRFETTETTLRGSTHLVWLDSRTIVTPIGAHFYRLDVDDLSRAERLAEHRVQLPHGMKRSASGRYVCYGAMDHPTRGEAREVSAQAQPAGWGVRPRRGYRPRAAAPVRCNRPAPSQGRRAPGVSLSRGGP